MKLGSTYHFLDLANLDGDGSYVTAALGNTWSHSVNTRLIVQYLDGQRRQVRME